MNIQSNLVILNDGIKEKLKDSRGFEIKRKYFKKTKWLQEGPNHFENTLYLVLGIIVLAILKFSCI
jgi:hypothetical protein